jgi:two-component system, OmpR family, response regulator
MHGYPKNILLVTPADSQWASSCACLPDYGYTLTHMQKGDEAVRAVASGQVALVLLDTAVPEVDHLDLVRDLKAAADGTTLPVIVLHGAPDRVEAVVSLETGADDFITGPLEGREIAARVRANLRLAHESPGIAPTPEAAADGPITFCAWTLDAGAMTLTTLDGAPVDLTTGEFQLLEALVHARGRVVPRAELFEVTRGTGHEAYDRAVDVQIARLRKKLAASVPDAPCCIKTVRGVGYQLMPCPAPAQKTP